MSSSPLPPTPPLELVLEEMGVNLTIGVAIICESCVVKSPALPWLLPFVTTTQLDWLSLCEFLCFNWSSTIKIAVNRSMVCSGSMGSQVFRRSCTSATNPVIGSAWRIRCVRPIRPPVYDYFTSTFPRFLFQVFALWYVWDKECLPSLILSSYRSRVLDTLGAVASAHVVYRYCVQALLNPLLWTRFGWYVA